MKVPKLLQKMYQAIAEKDKETEKKLKEAIEKGVTEGEAKAPKGDIKERAKKVADFIRKGKLSRPDIFTSATPAALVWDGALEAARAVDRELKAGRDRGPLMGAPIAIKDLLARHRSR